MPDPERRTPVAILGATGAVGQRLVQALERHPWFALAEAVASERSAGKRYGEAAHWLLASELPAAAAAVPVLAPGAALQSRLVLSALDSATAAALEPLYAERGHVVVSNASTFRMDPRVPLLVPEINAHAAERIREQPWAAAGGGLVTNPNCSVVGIVMALAPLHQAFGLEAVTCVTMQAVSGAGYPGVPSLDILGNVIPDIGNGGEEAKIASEPQKILEADFPLSVAVNRVPVVDGHTVSMFVKLRRRAGLDDIRRALDGFSGEPQRLKLPSAPERPLQVIDRADRPQPLRDVMRGNGMTVSVGNLRADPVYDVRFTVLVHNTVRGAAGAALLNAELLAAKGLLGLGGGGGGGPLMAAHRSARASRDGQRRLADLVVLKFGGSSVYGGEKIAGVAELVAERSEPRLVVVSAMGKVTSELQKLAALAAQGDVDAAQRGLGELVARHERALHEAVASAGRQGGGTSQSELAWALEAIAEETRRLAEQLAEIYESGFVSGEHNDAVVSLGELLSSRLLTAALCARGVAAIWIDPRDLIATDDGFGGARPDRARIFRQAQALALPPLLAGKVVVTGGYVGRAHSGPHQGKTTTMGRESSDLTATLLGGALRATAVEIWTDVDGILTADPRLVPDARLIPALSFAEAACLARLGAKVIHPDTVAPAQAAGAVVRIRNRFRPQAAGSVIGPAPAQTPLWGIAAREVLLASSTGRIVKARFPVEGSWALATGYRLGSVPLQLRVARGVLEHVGKTARVLVSIVGRVNELDGDLLRDVRQTLRDLDAVPVPGRGIAISHLLPLGEAREAVERLHRAAFARVAAPVVGAPAREAGALDATGRAIA